MSISPNYMINPGNIEHSGAVFVTEAKVEDAATVLRKVLESYWGLSSSKIQEALHNILTTLGGFEEPEQYLQASAEQLKFSLGLHR